MNLKARIDEINEKYAETRTKNLDLNELAIWVNANDYWDDDDLEALKDACPLYDDPVTKIAPDLDEENLLEYCKIFGVRDHRPDDYEYIIAKEDARAAFEAALADDELDEDGRAAMESILEDWDNYENDLRIIITDVKNLIEDREAADEKIDQWCEENHFAEEDHEYPELHDDYWIKSVIRQSDKCDGKLKVQLFSGSSPEIDIMSESDYKKFRQRRAEWEDRMVRELYERSYDD